MATQTYSLTIRYTKATCYMEFLKNYTQIQTHCKTGICNVIISLLLKCDVMGQNQSHVAKH